MLAYQSQYSQCWLTKKHTSIPTIIRSREIFGGFAECILIYGIYLISLINKNDTVHAKKDEYHY